MKTIVLLSCCPEHSLIDWNSVISSLPCICWGIIALVALFFLLKFVFSPLIANCHEINMKVKSFENEEKWADRKEKRDDLEKKNNELKSSTDEELKKAKKELENQLELEKTKSQLLEKKLEFYKMLR